MPGSLPSRAAGAFRMGLRLDCLDCCWILMGLLFVGGVTNLLWIAAIAVFILLIEKIMPFGARWISRWRCDDLRWSPESLTGLVALG